MEVTHTPGMFMNMKVNAVTVESQYHAGTQYKEHHPDQNLQEGCERRIDSGAQELRSDDDT